MEQPDKVGDFVFCRDDRHWYPIKNITRFRIEERNGHRYALAEMQHVEGPIRFEWEDLVEAMNIPPNQPLA